MPAYPDPPLLFPQALKNLYQWLKGLVAIVNAGGGDADSIQGVDISATPPTAGQVLTATDADSAEWDDPAGGSSGGAAIYGDGSGGAHTVAGTETLTGPAAYTDLTVPLGTILDTAGYPITVSGTLTWDGTIRSNGNPGISGTGGAASQNWRFAGLKGNAGGNGKTTAGDASASDNGIAGKAGGAGGSGTGGAGGASGTMSGFAGVPRRSTYFNLTSASASLGGGGGGGNSVQVGGGGGGGASPLLIAARAIACGASAVAQSKGGAGATGNASNCGGGGGGAGAHAEVVCDSITGSLTIDASGGAGGASGGGAGVAGSAGTAGTGLILIPNL